MNTFRPADASEVAAAHTAYMSAFDWHNAKGVRQWLRALSPETFAQRRPWENRIKKIPPPTGVATSMEEGDGNREWPDYIAAAG